MSARDQGRPGSAGGALPPAEEVRGSVPTHQMLLPRRLSLPACQHACLLTSSLPACLPARLPALPVLGCFSNLLPCLSCQVAVAEELQPGITTSTLTLLRAAQVRGRAVAAASCPAAAAAAALSD